MSKLGAQRELRFLIYIGYVWAIYYHPYVVVIAFGLWLLDIIVAAAAVEIAKRERDERERERAASRPPVPREFH